MGRITSEDPDGEGAAHRSSDGWHALPSGGMVLLEQHRPRMVSDGGRWNLSELRILAEAEVLTGFRLEFIGPRWKRWTRAPYYYIWFKPKGMWRWNLARVRIVACERVDVSRG